MPTELPDNHRATQITDKAKHYRSLQSRLNGRTIAEQVQIADKANTEAYRAKTATRAKVVVSCSFINVMQQERLDICLSKDV